MNVDERYRALVVAANRKRQLDSLLADLGVPDVPSGLAAFRSLPDCDGRCAIDRMLVELKYGDEIEW
jgi:hypothetical protein